MTGDLDSCVRPVLKALDLANQANKRILRIIPTLLLATCTGTIALTHVIDRTSPHGAEYLLWGAAIVGFLNCIYGWTLALKARATYKLSLANLRLIDPAAAAKFERGFKWGK